MFALNRCRYFDGVCAVPNHWFTVNTADCYNDFLTYAWRHTMRITGWKRRQRLIASLLGE